MESPRHRMVVVESVYYQKEGEQPTCVESKWSQFLQSDEPPYHRTLKVGKEWQEVSLGWAEDCAMLLLKNEEGKFQIVPTEEERKAVEALVIQVAIDGTLALKVGPGQSARFTSPRGTKLSVRCLTGIARLTVVVFPR